jgi:hypothetical protein
MVQKKRLTYFTLAVLFALLAAAVMPLAAFAQDEAPPADPAGESAPPAEEMTMPEVLEQLPEDTELVIVDAEGDPVPLASMEAAEALTLPDPKFCPNDNCATAIVRGTIAEAIADAYASGLSGIIYIEAGTFNETVSLSGFIGYGDAADVPQTLAIIGAGSGQTIINGNMNIYDVNTFTLQGFTLNGGLFFDNNNSHSEHTGDIVITDVAQDGGGTNHDNYIGVDNGDLTVTNSKFNNNTDRTFVNVEGGKSTVTDNEFKDNGNTGLIIGGEALVSGNTFVGNNNYGVFGKIDWGYAAGTTQIICDNVFDGNGTDIGIWAVDGMIAQIDTTVSHTIGGTGTVIDCTECLPTGGGSGGGEGGNSFAPTVIIVPVPAPFENGALPGDLPSGNAFGAGMNLTLREGSLFGPIVDYAPGGVTVFFEIPEDLLGKSLSVLVWEDGKWVSVPVVIDGNKAYFTASKPGAYVLVVK